MLPMRLHKSPAVVEATTKNKFVIDLDLLQKVNNAENHEGNVKRLV